MASSPVLAHNLDLLSAEISSHDPHLFYLEMASLSQAEFEY
jgi:hypothetical protein